MTPSDLLLSCSLRLASRADVEAVDHFQRKYSDQVGFLRRSDLLDLVSRGTVCIASAGGQEVGSLVWSGGQRAAPCLRQVCVPEDLWRQGIGESMTRFFVHCAPGRVGDVPRVRTRLDLREQLRINNRIGAILDAVKPGGRRGWPVGEFRFPDFAVGRVRATGVMVPRSRPIDLVEFVGGLDLAAAEQR